MLSSSLPSSMVTTGKEIEKEIPDRRREGKT
jgi:hypothetical protein